MPKSKPSDVADFSGANPLGLACLCVSAFKDGVAELSGTIFDERERMAAKVAAENVPGVEFVIDQLTWIDPYYGAAVPLP